jgi:hypothetical protein
MQDATSSPALLEHSDHGSRASEVDLETGSKPTTASSGKRRLVKRRPTFRPDLTVNARTNGHDKKHNYAPPASDRESWWRVSIKV